MLAAGQRRHRHPVRLHGAASSRWARRRIPALAHPRPPARAASAGRRPGVPAAGVDAGLPGRQGARATERFDAIDHVMTYFFTDQSGLTPFLELSNGAGRRGPEAAAAAAGTARRLCGAAQGRRRRGSRPAPTCCRGGRSAACTCCWRRARQPPTELVDVDGVGGVWSADVARRRRDAWRVRSAGQSAHLLLPRRRPGGDGGAVAARAGGPVDAGRRRAAAGGALLPRRALRMGSLCAVRGLNAYRLDGRLRQGALTGGPAERICWPTGRPPKSRASRRSGFPRFPAISTR